MPVYPPTSGTTNKSDVAGDGNAILLICIIPKQTKAAAVADILPLLRKSSHWDTCASPPLLPEEEHRFCPNSGANCVCGWERGHWGRPHLQHDLVKVRGEPPVMGKSTSPYLFKNNSWLYCHYWQREQNNSVFGRYCMFLFSRLNFMHRNTDEEGWRTVLIIQHSLLVSSSPVETPWQHWRNTVAPLYVTQYHILFLHCPKTLQN